MAIPSPGCWVIHASSKDSPGISQIRSHGRIRKSPVMAACTLGSRRISAVPEVCSRLSGARSSAFGRGSVRR